MTTQVLLFTDRAAAIAPELARHLTRAGIQTKRCSTSSVAAWLLEERPYSLCLIHLTDNTCGGDNTRALLQRLHRSYPHLIAIVTAPTSATPNWPAMVCQSHPGVLTHALDADAIPMLVDRVRRLLGRSIGDVASQGGLLMHLPTGTIFTHPVATRLVSAYPHWIRVPRAGGGVTAVFRLRKWLDGCGSQVSVEALRGTGEYRIVCSEVGDLSPGRDGDPPRRTSLPGCSRSVGPLSLTGNCNSIPIPQAS